MFQLTCSLGSWLIRGDAIEKKTFSYGFPIDKYKHMASYEEFIKSIAISFNNNQPQFSLQSKCKQIL